MCVIINNILNQENAFFWWIEYLWGLGLKALKLITSAIKYSSHFAWNFAQNGKASGLNIFNSEQLPFQNCKCNAKNT